MEMVMEVNLRSVIDSLIKIAEIDPLPEAHTSSYWRQYGTETVVERHGKDLVLKPAGFESVVRMGRLGEMRAWIERTSYWRYTSRLRSYRAVSLHGRIYPEGWKE